MQKLIQQATIDFASLKQITGDLDLPTDLLLVHENAIITAFAHSDFISKVALQYPKRFVHALISIDEAILSVTQYCATEHSTAEHSTAEHDNSKRLTSEYSSSEHSTAKNSTVKHNSSKHGNFKANALLEIAFYDSKLQALDEELLALTQSGISAQALEIQAGIAIRQFRQIHMLCIAFFDIHKMQSIETSLLAVSRLANHIINAANNCLYDALCTRYGSPQNKQPLLIMAMGKLGGNELNFSSDIDLIFTYPEQGETQALTPGKKTLEHQVFFTRLAQKFIAMLDQITQDGFAYRVDMRLRPMGDSGPLVLPFSALESYYQDQGRQWERFAMQKMRIVNDTPYNATLYKIIRPFVYRKYIDFTSIESIREMKLLIEKEVRRRQINHNIKLGEGGIREVEFFIQSLQLIHAGRHPQCQHNSILLSMQALQEAELTGDVDMQQLKDDYLYLRKIEHYLQMFNDEQTQTLPFSDGKSLSQNIHWAQARLCSLVGSTSTNNDIMSAHDVQTNYAQLCETISACMSRIHIVFNSFIEDPNNLNAPSVARAINKQKHTGNDEKIVDSSNAEIISALDDIWQLSLHKSESIDALASALSEEAADVFVEHILKFQKKTQREGVSERAQKSINKLMPLLLSEMVVIEGEFSDEVFTDQVQGVFDILHTICGRVTYIDLLLEHPEVRARLLHLCKKSLWVAQQIAQYPILLDELLHPVYLDHNELSLTQYKAQCADELRQFMLRVDIQDEEQIMDRLREFKHTTQLRIAAGDISATLAINQVSDKLTLLAEVIMQKVIDIAWQQIVVLFGKPTVAPDLENTSANQLALIAYGKFGGIELSYGSDLDVVFLHNADLSLQTEATGSRKQLSNQEFYIKLVQRICHICTTKTYSGILYDIDLRLRPSGNSGLLVSHINTFFHYQDTSAWTWEHQALVRSRVVVGNAPLTENFNEVRRAILCKPRDANELKQQVLEMRNKMRAHLETIQVNLVDIKQTKGGIVDIEFMVQYWILANAHEHSHITTWSDNLRLLESLQVINAINEEQLESLTNAYLLQRHATHRVQLANRKLARGGDKMSKKLISSFAEVNKQYDDLFS